MLAPHHRRQIHPLLRTGLLPLTPGDGAGLYEGIAPLETAKAAAGSSMFLPQCRGRLQFPSDYAEDIVAGFSMASRILSGSLHDRFIKGVFAADHRVGQARLLLRSTAEYYTLLRESLSLRYMRRGGGRIGYLFAQCRASQPDTRIAEEETRALFRCSIPRFTGATIPCRLIWQLPSIVESAPTTKLLSGRLADPKTHARPPIYQPTG
jgi:Domain of unknown function (DUF4135)